MDYFFTVAQQQLRAYADSVWCITVTISSCGAAMRSALFRPSPKKPVRGRVFQLDGDFRFGSPLLMRGIG